MTLSNQFEGENLDTYKDELFNLLLDEEGVKVHESRIMPQPRSSDSTRSFQAPASFAQQRLWFLEQFEPGNPAYNIPYAARLTGFLRQELLLESVNEIIERHESLRTTFKLVANNLQQCVKPHLRLSFTVADLTDLTPHDQEAFIAQAIGDDMQNPFDLVNGPLLRVALLCLKNNEHVLLMNMHHIIADGWSQGILIQELAQFYRAKASGDPAGLPDLPVQYADYAIWQREHLADLKPQLDYWRQKLQGPLPVLDMPVDFPRPSIQTFHGASLSFSLSPALSAAIRRLQKQADVTPFMLLLAAYQACLHRYTGQEDILVGSPIAGRRQLELEPLIGLFVNTLVLRADFGDNPSFRMLLWQMRQTILDAFSNQDVPFEQLVNEVQLERDTSRNPLFQAMFVLQNTPVEHLEVADLQMEILEFPSQSAKFDIWLSMMEATDCFVGSIEYNTDLFLPDTIRRFLTHFEQLLTAVTTFPDRPLTDISLLTPNEMEKIKAWNNTTQIYPAADVCLHRHIERKAAQTPQAPAVIFGNTTLTYAQLNHRANQLAHTLQAYGVEAETLVGICLERSWEMVVGLLAILKAGGAYVPLDPNYPSERLHFMLQDAQVSLLLTHTTLHDKFANHATTTLDLDEFVWSDDPISNREFALSEQNLAYVIYTSGSTGQPKGAMNTHRAIVNRLLWMQDAYQLTPSDRVLQKTPFSFDVSVWEFFWPLMVGATLVVAAPDVHKDSAALVALVQEAAVTTMHFVPSMLRYFLAEPAVASCRSLRRVFCSGEALSPAYQEQFFAVLSAELHNLYGPTEAAVDVTAWPCQPDINARTVPIGKPIANIQTHLLDSQYQPVPVGIPGELYIGGIGLARGYWRRAALTAEKFIPDPFAAQAGNRLYRTGDLARYLPDGTIEFLGRTDHQVKVRGFRIELGEIETQLLQHPSIQSCVVIAQEKPSQDTWLLAYFVPEGSPPTTTDLHTYLRQHLPEYMVPAHFISLAEIPLSPNGKVDRRALPAPDTERPTLTQTYVPPQTEYEITLTSIWQEVLGIKKVGIHDNFFELGGDSILSLQVVAQANEAGLHITTKQMFQNQTIARLAAVTNTAVVVAAEQGPVTGFIPLTPIQHWFFEQMLMTPQHFNQAVLLAVKPDLKFEWVEEAVSYLWHYHDAFRLRFVQTDGSWQQINGDIDTPPPLSRYTVSDLPALESAVDQIQTEFDLSHGPLIRFVWFDLPNPHPAHLLIVAHHLVIDGVSWRILLGDLQQIYQQLAQDRPIHLPPKTTSLQQWANALVDYAHTPAVQNSASYWQMETAVTNPLPVSSPLVVNLNQVGDAATYTHSFSQADTTALRQELLPAYHIQLDDVLLTALVHALQAWCGQQTYVIDMEGHGREPMTDAYDLSRTIGWFTTIFPLRLSVLDPANPANTLVEVKEKRRAVPERGLSYGCWRYLQAQHTANSGMPSQILFNYLGQFDQMLPQDAWFRQAQASSGMTQALNNQRRYLFELNCLIAEHSLHITWTYNPTYHSRDIVEQLAESMQSIMQSLIAHSHTLKESVYTPSDFPLANLDKQGLQKLSALLNDLDDEDF